jgi:hypothetical protein
MKIIITESQLKSIIQEEVGGNIQIRPFRREDTEPIIERLSDVYSVLGMPSGHIWSIIRGQCGGDFSNSVVATKDDEVIGFYFLSPKNLPSKGEIKKGMRGIEGVGLGIFPEHKDLGIGKMMIEYPKNLGFDYIWGMQFKQLGNIQDWLKRRKIYSDEGNVYITYQIFTPNTSDKDMVSGYQREPGFEDPA